MFDENGKIKKETFEINIMDVKRIVGSLELTADFDKTEIYYVLKDWLEKETK